MANRSVTLKDVAAHAGVALGTASRVINGFQDVTPSMRAKVERAMADLGYAPNPVAQSMRSGATRTIGVMVRDMMLPTFAAFVQNAQETFLTAGYMLILTCTGDKKEQELALLQRLAQRRVDGLIMTTTDESDVDLRMARENLTIPYLMLDRDSPEGADTLSLEHEQAMREAMSYLIGLGHRRIGLVTGLPGVRPGRKRSEAYFEALRDHGLPTDETLVRARGFDAEGAFTQTTELLSRDPRPTAIIAGGVATLTGVLEAVRAHQLEIPKDISIIAGADSSLAKLHRPSMTAFKWDYGLMGRLGADYLLNRLDKSATTANQPMSVPMEFIIRHSCAAPTDT